jgi:hypothetical protein
MIDPRYVSNIEMICNGEASALNYNCHDNSFPQYQDPSSSLLVKFTSVPVRIKWDASMLVHGRTSNPEHLKISLSAEDLDFPITSA